MERGETASNLSEGSCEVTVTDAAGNTAVAKINIVAPKQLSATISVEAPASTNNADGRATVKASGGAGKYGYRWDNQETTRLRHQTRSRKTPGDS